MRRKKPVTLGYLPTIFDKPAFWFEDGDTSQLCYAEYSSRAAQLYPSRRAVKALIRRTLAFRAARGYGDEPGKYGCLRVVAP